MCQCVCSGRSQTPKSTPRNPKHLTPTSKPSALSPTHPNPQTPSSCPDTLHSQQTYNQILNPKKKKLATLHTTQKKQHKLATLQTHNPPLETRLLTLKQNPKLKPLTHSPPTQHTAYPSRATHPCRMQVPVSILCSGRGGMRYGGRHGIRYLGLHRDAVKR